MTERTSNHRSEKSNKNDSSKKKFSKERADKILLAKQRKATMREKGEIEQIMGDILNLTNLNADGIDSFECLPISLYTKKGLKEADFQVPTKVQRQSLVHSLQGLDVVAAAKTGSGKTLAFLIPLLELLYRKMWNSMDGMGAVIITPTRELAYQIYEVLKKVGKRHTFSAGLIIGGKDLKFEWKRISACNIVICTPGRLLQHMTENPEFDCLNTQILVLDEADQCLSMGFAKQMSVILDEMPKDRQTLLFSATQTRDVKDLVRAGCKNPIYVSSHEHSKSVTPKTLLSSYYICEEHNKMTFLWSFLKQHKRSKSLVFFSTCKQVKYMFNIFCKLHPGISVLAIHGGMHQLRRMAVYDRFCKEDCAVLFATDVAARGLDIPAVSWVLQMDCPEDVTTYIHRAGRTARHLSKGEALLILTPHQENEMVAALKSNNIPINKINVDDSYLNSVHVKIEGILGKYSNLKEDAVRAFKSYLKCVHMMKNKRIFDVNYIDADTYARSLGLVVTPRVRFIERSKKKNYFERLEKDPTERKPRTTLDFGSKETDDEDEDNEFLVSSKGESKVEMDIDKMCEESGEQDKLDVGNVKVTTKYALVKKMKKRNTITNTRVVFDDEGEAVNDPAKSLVSDDGKSGVTSQGINIQRMQEVIKAEDRVDKKLENERIKEKQRKKQVKEKASKQAKRDKNKKVKKEEKNEEIEDFADEDECYDEDSDASDNSVNDLIHELPDPDKLYGDKFDISDYDDFESYSKSKKRLRKTSQNNNSDTSEEENTQLEPLKQKKKTDKRTEPKQQKLDRTISTLGVKDKEEIALMLLRGGL